MNSPTTWEEYLYILDSDGNVTWADTRKKAHEDWLIHGHCELWIPSDHPEHILIQKRKPKLKDWVTVRELDSTIGGHVDCDPDKIWESLGKNIAEVWRKSIIKETWEEAGISITDGDFELIDTFHHLPDKNPRFPLWNRTFTPVYMLMQKRKLEELKSTEAGIDFVEMRVAEIINLQPDDTRFVWNVRQKHFKEILRKIEARMRKL
jgi:8-oxo-dGTP pyrophosphatase MutT (NUDIX family)